MIVRFALHHRMRELHVGRVGARSVRINTLRNAALHDGRVVRIGEDRSLRIDCVGVPDHAEQRVLHFLAVDDPVRIEDLVPAMLGIRLREHRQFRIGRITPQGGVRRREIVDLVLGKREPEFCIRGAKRRARIIT